jgi:hypothetical protein
MTRTALSAQKYYQKILEVAVDQQGQLLPIASFGLFRAGGCYIANGMIWEGLSYLDKGIRLESGKLGRWQVDGIRPGSNPASHGRPGGPPEVSAENPPASQPVSQI